MAARLTAALLLLGMMAPAGAQPAPPAADSADGYWDLWLASVQHLMSDTEYRFFRELEHGRELFVHHFWEVRASAQGDTAQPLRERWRQNLVEVSRQLGTVYSDRARAMLLAGKPGQVLVCRGCGLLRDLEVWTYSPWQIAAQSGRPETDGLSLLFFLAEDGGGQYYRQWSPGDGIAALVRGRGTTWTAERLVERAAATGCCELDQEEREMLATALRQGLGKRELLQRLHPPVPSPGWLALLAAELSAPAAGDAPAAPAATAEIAFPGGYQGATLVQVRVQIPVELVERAPGRQLLLDRLVIDGDVWAGGRLVDAFSAVTLVSGEPPGDTIPLDLCRLLDPRTYLLGLWVSGGEGAGSRPLLHLVRELRVPVAVADGTAPVDPDRLTAGHIDGMAVFPSVKLLSPGPDLVVGKVDIAAVTIGEAIAGVDFLLDGEPVASDSRPPYSVELRLGRAPRRHTVTAMARDAGGRPLARDELVLNGGPHRFAVRLVEPVPGAGGGRAQVVVEVPENERLDRVELYLDDTLLVILRQPPFLHPLPRAATGRAQFIRAVACLDSRCLEDTVLLHQPPGFSEEIDVRVVELFTTVVDAEGRSVTGLSAERFRVLEDGVEQPLLSFATMDDLPIHVALLVDFSLSMQLRKEIATDCALQFFERVLGERDRAALLSFHQDIRLLVPFTNDLQRLRYGLAGVSLELGTRLWDGLVHAGHYLGGLQGKRALVVITDGLDYHSRLTFRHALEHALSSGVAVYPITIDLVDPLPRAQLQQLAEESGGRFFALGESGELAAIYRQLEQELRCQYLLTYQAPDSGDRSRLRTVEVQVLPSFDAASAAAPGDGQVLSARTIHGYYP